MPFSERTWHFKVPQARYGFERYIHEEVLSLEDLDQRGVQWYTAPMERDENGALRRSPNNSSTIWLLGIKYKDGEEDPMEGVEPLHPHRPADPEELTFMLGPGVDPDGVYDLSDVDLGEIARGPENTLRMRSFDVFTIRSFYPYAFAIDPA